MDMFAVILDCVLKLMQQENGFLLVLIGVIIGAGIYLFKYAFTVLQTIEKNCHDRMKEQQEHSYEIIDKQQKMFSESLMLVTDKLSEKIDDVGYAVRELTPNKLRRTSSLVDSKARKRGLKL